MPALPAPGAGIVSEEILQVGRRRVRVTHPERNLFPGDGVTKGDLAEYYARSPTRSSRTCATGRSRSSATPTGSASSRTSTKRRRRASALAPDAPLPHLAPRGGVAARRLHARQRASRPRLDGAENGIDMNAWYSRVDKPERPDYVVFDLDPPETRNGFSQAIQVAHLVREALEDSSSGRTSRRAVRTESTCSSRSRAVPPIPRLPARGARVARPRRENPGVVTTEW